MECPICYEAITAETGVVTTSCQHSYHFACVSGWFIKQEKGTCPCCRKEMNEKEDFPDVPAEHESSHDSEESYESESEDEYEVEFSRRQLQEFIESHGGHLTEQMSDAICSVIASFTKTELNSLLVGNTGQVLTEEKWLELLARPSSEPHADQEEPSMRITIGEEGRSVVLNDIYETAAMKIQSAWRTQKAAEALISLKN